MAPVAAPTANWSIPSSADAAPAWCGKGAIAAAVALGRISPTVARQTKMLAKKAGNPPAPVQARTGRSRADSRVDHRGRAEDGVGVIAAGQPPVDLG